MALILVADVQDGPGRLRRVLSSEHHVIVAGKVDSAVEILRKNNIDVIVCNVQFDESRMLDFLQCIKRFDNTVEVPFLYFKETKASLSLKLDHGMDIAARELGASGYIDASDGASLADADLLQIVRDTLPSRCSL